MRASAPTGHEIVPRQDLDFDLDAGGIARYWLGGDAFRSRFFDAMSTLFPEGEGYFIACVRDFRDQVADPVLQARVRGFIFQEAQHGRVHARLNERLREQGVNVDRLLQRQKEVLTGYRRARSRQWTLAQTAAAEHMTALLAHFFLEHPAVLRDADPRVRAIYFWHAIEEIEHKAVAFDVLTRVARPGYLTRVGAMLWESVLFPCHVFLIVRYMFRVDGLTRGQRAWLWLGGLWWLYGPGGVCTRMLPHYLAYYLPGFHPWKRGGMAGYQRWREAYANHGGDPVAAAEALLASP